MSAGPVAGTGFSPNGSGRDAAASAPLLEISNAMVRLYKEAFGRGPTKARTLLAGPDTVVVVLEDGFTVAERRLRALDEINALRDSRLLLQEALEARARAAVETALGRQTLAYVTGVDPRRDVAITVLTLEPAMVADGDHRGAVGRGEPG